jgi:hypothetical protein
MGLVLIRRWMPAAAGRWRGDLASIGPAVRKQRDRPCKPLPYRGGGTLRAGVSVDRRSYGPTRAESRRPEPWQERLRRGRHPRPDCLGHCDRSVCRWSVSPAPSMPCAPDARDRARGRVCRLPPRGARDAREYSAAIGGTASSWGKMSSARDCAPGWTPQFGVTTLQHPFAP